MYIKLKTKIFNIMQSDGGKLSRGFDFFIIALIIINVCLVIADTFNVPPYIKQIFNIIDVFSVVVFSIEYILRLWTADFIYPELSPSKARFKYIFTFMALIDLFAILPFYIPFIIPVDLRVLRTLRVVRLLRLFKVNRYTNALSTIGDVFKRKASQLLSSMFIVLLLMVVASVLMYNVENPAQPDVFNNAFSGLWWAVATLTTVGYGDIYPVTVAGKILSAVIAILGIGLVAVPTGIISAGFLDHVEHTDNDENPEIKYCPYCGHKVNVK